MGLRDIKLPSATIQVTDDQGFVVRGLGAREIANMIGNYREVVQPVYDKFIETKEDGTADKDVSGIVTEIFEFMTRKAPDLLSEIIATAADDTDKEGVEAAARLPPTVQIAALEQIFFLTFRTEAERKNAVETVIRAIQGTNGIFKSLTPRR